MTRATLYRRLKAERTSYEQLLEDVRQRLARRYLGKDGEFGQSDGLSPWLFRPRGVQPGIQALDRDQPQRISRLKSRRDANSASVSARLARLQFEDRAA